MQPTPATVDTETTAEGAAKPYELDDENFKTVAKGSLFLTHTDTIHAIPFHSAVQTDASGNDKFRTCKSRRTASAWTTHECLPRQTLEMNYKAALLGVLSKKKNSGANADKLFVGGLPAKISVVLRTWRQDREARPHHPRQR